MRAGPGRRHTFQPIISGQLNDCDLWTALKLDHVRNNGGLCSASLYCHGLSDLPLLKRGGSGPCGDRWDLPAPERRAPECVSHGSVDHGGEAIVLKPMKTVNHFSH